MSSKSTKNRQQALAERGETSTERAKGGPSAIAVIRRLPTAVLLPGVVVLFAALVTDLVVADPLPLVDEATLLWGLVQGMRVLGERRRERRQAREAELEARVVADVMPDGEPAAATTR